jgi:hypothetical protein
MSDMVRFDARATAAGARLLEVQPNDHCRVYTDPAGHPFCLSTWEARQLFEG